MLLTFPAPELPLQIIDTGKGSLYSDLRTSAVIVLIVRTPRTQMKIYVRRLYSTVLKQLWDQRED